MASFVKRVTLVDLSGSGTTTVLFSSKKKKRKVSRWLQPVERGDRRFAQAVQAFGEKLVSGHEKSNRKRRNGWLRDGNSNVMRANRAALKKLTRM